MTAKTVIIYGQKMISYKKTQKEAHNMKNYLIVVDMQRDFVTGVLGSQEAVSILPAVKERIEKAKREGEAVIFTRDTHEENYLETQEGKKLPVKHCVKNTAGWQIEDELLPLSEKCLIIDKPTFGSTALGEYLKAENEKDKIGKITLTGVCTDICVISNALLIKAYLPEVEIYIEENCCAGVTKESHETALSAMKSCQITVI